MKKKIIISIIILCFILLIFSIYKFISNFQQDQEITKEKINEITENYDNFNKSVLTFVQSRDNLYQQIENAYLEDISQHTTQWNKTIENYQNTIQNVEDNSQVLKENCIVKFADPSTNSKCTIFKSTYEAAMNYYISDIKIYNQTVSEYNQWATTNNQPKLNKGQFIIYKKYIDYDDDKEYFGKEEVKNE